jgi:hypothetical protein
MNCRTTNQIDSSLAVIENGVLMFNCTCTHCGNRLVSMKSPEDMGMEKEKNWRDEE